ncbi:MAG TPA: hypothetical protein VI540_02275 [Gaiellaceae bacterium]|nr:hypothetical protein [Gaiellaceae bacterium]
MRTVAELLFEEFAARFARGEHPDVRDYLERAADDRDELAALLDGFVAASHAPAPSAETLATFAELVPTEESAPPMLAARVRLGLHRSQVVGTLAAWLGVVPEKEEKLARYYHELETGLLDPRGVEAIVWHHLAKIFGTGIRSLMLRPNEPPPAMVAAYYRHSDDLALAAPAAPAPSPEVAEPERDEIDRLFTGSGER